MSDSVEDRAPQATAESDPWWSLARGAALVLVLVALTLLLLYGTLSFYHVVLVLICASYFSLSYLSYLQFRAEIHKERVKDDFRLLGLVRKAGEAKDLDQVYRQIYSPQQFVIYVSLVTLLTLLGFGLYHFRAILVFTSEMVAVTMFYSFLGAYAFSIYYVYRRYITLDLQPGVYLYVAVRMTTVQVIAFVAAAQLQVATEGTQALVAIAAFVIGYFPDTGIRWLVATVERFFGRLLQRNERRLSTVQGISLWHETRLLESGIDNVQNLAAADVRELLLGSRFSAQQLMHWIDQAILITNAADETYKKLGEHGIRTISALRSLLDNVDSQELLDMGLPLADLRAMYHAADVGPNLHYVTQYWNALKKYRIEIVTGSLAEMLRERAEQVAQRRLSDPGVVERLSEVMVSLQVDPQDLELLFPDSSESLEGLGSVYIQRQLYGDAVRVLTQAIEADSQSAAAYSSRGLAYAMQDDYARAFADFDRAEKLAPGYAVTFQHEGLASIRQGNLQEAIKSLGRAVELDRTYASAYYNRGYAHRRLGQLVEAIDDFDQALRHDRELYLAYLERGIAYLSLGRFFDAIQDLSDAIRLNRTHAGAYSNRGAAYMGMGDHQRALYDLDTAIELEPRLAAAYANRGQARYELGDSLGAIADFDQALLLDSQLAQAYKGRALVHAARRALLEAIADFEAYLKLKPTVSDADDVRGWIEQLRQRLPTEPEPASTDPEPELPAS